MCFQTGQVIFLSQNGQRGSLLVFWPHSVFWTDFALRRFQFPISRPDDRAIPSGRPSDHCSIRPDDVPYRPNARQTSIICLGTYFSVRTLQSIEKLLFQLASVRTSQQPVRTSINDRSASDSFQVQNKGRLIHSPDDVVSRPDALINKARIAIQIPPSGRQSALVRTRAHQLRKLPIRLQPFGRLPLMVRTRA